MAPKDSINFICGTISMVLIFKPFISSGVFIGLTSFVSCLNPKGNKFKILMPVFSIHSSTNFLVNGLLISNNLTATSLEEKVKGISTIPSFSKYNDANTPEDILTASIVPFLTCSTEDL
ncbi:hypothetical protein ES705_45646 [subsurface metagenome]